MISLIWAMTKNNLIGKDNDLPWHYKEDLQYFKKTTLNKDVLMWYNTYLSIFNRLGHSLPNRNNFVLCNNLTIEDNSITQVTSLDDFINEYKNSEKEIFIIGGASVYSQTLPVADRLYITMINKDYEGNVYFPQIDLSNYELIKKEDHSELSFLVYEKKAQ